MRTVAIASLIALGSTLCAGGPSADQIAGVVKAAAAIADGTTITTKLGGATVAVTRQNGMATCTVDGKPYAIRIPGPAPAVAGITTVTDTVALHAAAAGTGAPGSNPLFQNSLWWFGTPNPTPPPTSTVRTFTPLANLPGFSQPFFGWYRNLNFEACVLGLGNTTTTGVGPYGTTTSSVNCGC